MALSEDDIQAKREHVQELRDRVDELVREDAEKAAENANSLVAKQLDREAEALESRVAYLESVAKANSSPEVKPFVPVPETPDPVNQTVDDHDDDNE